MPRKNADDAMASSELARYPPPPSHPMMQDRGSGAVSCGQASRDDDHNRCTILATFPFAIKHICTVLCRSMRYERIYSILKLLHFARHLRVLLQLRSNIIREFSAKSQIKLPEKARTGEDWTGGGQPSPPIRMRIRFRGSI